LLLCLIPLGRTLAQATRDPWETIDADFDLLSASLVAPQEAYRGLAQRYLQIPPTGPAPIDGARAPLDLNKLSHDVPISARSAGLDKLDSLAISFRVDEYYGPSGWGYLIFAWAEVKGQVYERVQHVGPDPTFQSRDWYPRPEVSTA
jgi:hypothetical protein